MSDKVEEVFSINSLFHSLVKEVSKVLAVIYCSTISCFFLSLLGSFKISRYINLHCR